LKDIIVWAEEENKASNRVVEKLGFVEGGSVRNLDDGEMVPIWILPGMEKLDESVGISLQGEGN